MPTVNEVYNDASIEYLVRIERFISGQVHEFIERLRENDSDIIALTRDSLPVRIGSRAYRRLLRQMEDIRQVIFDEFQDDFAEVAFEFGEQVQQTEQSIIDEALISVADYESESPDNLDALLSLPYQTGINVSSTIDTIFQEILVNDRRRLNSALALGTANGTSNSDLIIAIRNLLDISNRETENAIRTALNFVSNYAKNTVHEANGEIFAAEYWVSVLDTRTSAVCRYRSGRVRPLGNFPLPPGAKLLEPPFAQPPAHIRCRSSLQAYFDLRNLFDLEQFRDEVAQRHGSDSVTEELLERARDRFLRKEVGPIPVEETYYEWLFRQSSSSQDRVLGPTRAKAFREGRIRAEDLHNTFGEPLTLEEIGLK